MGEKCMEKPTMCLNKVLLLDTDYTLCELYWRDEHHSSKKYLY